MSSRSRIRAVAFDYGNVLSRPQEAAAIASLVERVGVSVAEFSRRYFRDRPAYDRGSLTGAEYWTRVVGDPERTSSPLIEELIHLDVHSWSFQNDAVVGWARELRRAGLQVAILSNLPVEVLAGLRRVCGDWLAEFDAAVFSSEEACVKPEAEIYRRLIQRLRLEPADVLFVDDVRANVDGAEAAGMHAVHFESLDTARDEVAERFALGRPTG